MAKMRVYELARELGVESKVILAKAKSAGIDSAKSHQSTLAGDDVATLRSAFNGGEAPTKVAAAAAVKKPKTIIRRRKKTTDQDDGDSVEASAEAEGQSTAPKKVVKPTEAPEAKVAPKKETNTSALKAAEALFSRPATEKKKVEAVEEPKAPAEVVETPVKEEAKVVAAPEPKFAEAKEVAAKPVAVESKEVAEEESVKKIPRRKRESGATIVRKATPEEIEEQETRNNRQTGRREDHRGTRVTGMGLLKNRGQEEQSSSAPSAPSSSASEASSSDTPYSSSDKSSGGYTGRKSQAAASAKKKDDAAEEVARKTKKQKRASGALTARALLEQGASLEKELYSDAPVVPVSTRARTVYTPSGGNYRGRRDHKRRKDLKKTEVTLPKATKRIVRITGDSITVADLANQLSIKAAEIIKKLMMNGVMATINEPVDADTASLIASEYKYEVRNETVTVDDILHKAAPAEADLVWRAPIVTIMGHVDHGKTSILDAIKESNVVGGEAGGITQHIGAYSIVKDGKSITFLDTPGHEAFSTMRARGAQVTDIVILVVAADDGVMPQTIEAISHAKDAGVPLIVAVNKIDKPNINVERVYTELTEHGVQSEDWGGDTQFIKCSAHTKEGLTDLIDGILLQAELLELRASAKGPAEGNVIEAHLDKGRGPVATLVITSGTLRVGDQIVAGTEIGRVRAMTNHLGEEMTEVGPSGAVEVIGLSGVPMAGDIINSVESERMAREAADWRRDQAAMSASTKSSAQSLEDLLSRVQSEEATEVTFIIKGDTQGSVEAVSESIMKLNTDRVKNRIVHSAVGGVTSSDITLAAASRSVIIGFNTRASAGLDMAAERQGVLIRYFNIIYDIVDAVKAIMVGTLPPDINEVVLGHADVRKPITVPKIGTVAGSAVIDGKITRNSHCRLIRDDIVIYDGRLSSLRRFKDDVKEVATGYECGISIEGYNDIKEGDVIEAYILEESQATL